MSYDEYINNVYDDGLGIGAVSSMFEELRVTAHDWKEWFKVWEKIDVDLSRTMEYGEFIK